MTYDRKDFWLAMVLSLGSAHCQWNQFNSVLINIIAVLPFYGVVLKVQMHEIQSLFFASFNHL
jgi:hypothetical protein